MDKRFVSIWFRYFATDWFSLRQPELKKRPLVLRMPSHGRMIVTAINAEAERNGLKRGMVLADARALVPALEVLDDEPDKISRVLTKLGEWCIRFTPFVAIDSTDGLFFDATGCAHLWGSEEKYLSDIIQKIMVRGYSVRAAMADTPGAAWAIARYEKKGGVISPGKHIDALLPLPPQALRLEQETVERLHKLGLHQIKQFIRLPRTAMRKRFGPPFLQQLDKAIGQEMEMLEPIQPVEPYQERLPCLEPIVTSVGIEMALKQLLEKLCLRLQQEQKGLRTAVLKGYRVDGKLECISIATSRGGLEDLRLSELVDRLANKIGADRIHRYLPAEHHWPERSYQSTDSLQKKPDADWRTDVIRPVQLLASPLRIEVTAPIPDYPPLLFRHNGKVHSIVKADGPERIEQEWWLQQGQHRDYYRVEDEEGHRYWLFRLGHYHEETYTWFLHGYFA